MADRYVEQASVDQADPGSALFSKQELIRTRILEVLGRCDLGERADKYFGISSRLPEQAEEEGEASDKLLDELREAATAENADLYGLCVRLARHAATSALEPEALRQLTRPRKRV